MKRNKKVKPNDSSSFKTIKRIINVAKPHKIFFILAIICTFISIFLTLYTAVFTGNAIDLIIGKGQVDFVGIYRNVIWILFCAVVSAFAEWFAHYFYNILSYRTAESLRNQIFKKLNSVPLKYIDTTPHGNIINSVINDVENITDGFVSIIYTISSGIMTLSIVTILMLTINVSLALVVIFIAPLSLLVAKFITKKSNELFRIEVNETAKLSAYTTEMINSQKIIKAFNSEEQNIAQFTQINKTLYYASEKASFYSSLAGPSSRLINGVLYGIVGFVGALVAIKTPSFTAGKLSVFLNYSNDFSKPFNGITEVISDIQIALASARRVFNILDEKDEVSDRNLPVLKKCDGTVSLKNVYFSYDPAFHLLEHINIDAKNGEKIAIVGPTGCGKSTIINLLMRYYDVDKGQVIVSNKPITKIKRNSLRENYGMVLQESWLYHATIKENVAYGKPDATDDEIIQACKLSGAHSFIEKLPDGYDTMISERADNVSAGQKQLICISRIMLTKPPMLILDEATSNIDTRTEQKIQQALNYIMKGRTCFIVAHRLSTIMSADKIIVINKGRIIEQGTHDELLAQNGFYTKLFNSQFNNS